MNQGWADVPLTIQGEQQALAAGRCIEAFKIRGDAAYTSLLQRSKHTYELLSTVTHESFRSIPIINSWRLNERHYGALVGLSKEEANSQMGKENVMGWRRYTSTDNDLFIKFDTPLLSFFLSFFLSYFLILSVFPP